MFRIAREQQALLKIYISLSERVDCAKRSVVWYLGILIRIDYSALSPRYGRNAIRVDCTVAKHYAFKSSEQLATTQSLIRSPNETLIAGRLNLNYDLAVQVFPVVLCPFSPFLPLSFTPIPYLLLS